MQKCKVRCAVLSKVVLEVCSECLRVHCATRHLAFVVTTTLTQILKHLLMRGFKQDTEYVVCDTL